MIYPEGRLPTILRPAHAQQAELHRRHFLARVMASGMLVAMRPSPSIAQPGSGGSRRVPRIVNIYNFVRNSDPRLTNSEEILFNTTEHQIKLLRQLKLPCTFALQYDALINPRYQQLFKQQATAAMEIAAWWEIPRPLVIKAGLKWRGPASAAWGSHVTYDFSVGYSPAERKRLADVYMADFKQIFGRYPATVGSWYIDEITLGYFADRYGIVASCNCKDQAQTDGYTLWGGYWNQAYYPSRLNAWMPAQNRTAQIDVPVFRMLGSDPIYQYQSNIGGNGQSVITLEAVYSPGGRSPQWLDWYLDILAREPCLAFAYGQAGQENSFGWNAMKQGMELQFPLFAKLARSGELQVETLEQSGRWFRDSFKVTPATCVVAMKDWQHQGRKTVWYNSRFFRTNIYWHRATFVIRDIHLFNENVMSQYHQKAAATNDMAVYTLPIMDGFSWGSSRSNKTLAGIRLVALNANGARVALQMTGQPKVVQLNKKDLRIGFSLEKGAAMEIVCQEDQLTFRLHHRAGNVFNWALEMVWSAAKATGIGKVEKQHLAYTNQGVDYALMLGKGVFQRPSATRSAILLLPQKNEIVMALKSPVTPHRG